MVGREGGRAAMKNLFRLLVFLLLVGGWGLAATSLHLVRTPATASREFIVVPKTRLGFADTYVDTRAWTIDDVPHHKGVVDRMIDTEKYMAIAHVTGESEPAEVQERLADALLREPQPKVEATTTTTTAPAKKSSGKTPASKTSKRKPNARRQVAAR
jgi:hypothetical protein